MAGQLVKVAERLGGLRDEWLSLVRMVRARCAGISNPAAKPELSASIAVSRLASPGSAHAFGPDQRHEGDGAVVFFLELVIVDTADEQQRLVSTAADRDHEAAANGELQLERFRHFRAAGETRMASNGAWSGHPIVRRHG